MVRSDGEQPDALTAMNRKEGHGPVHLADGQGIRLGIPAVDENALVGVGRLGVVWGVQGHAPADVGRHLSRHVLRPQPGLPQAVFLLVVRRADLCQVRADHLHGLPCKKQLIRLQADRLSECDEGVERRRSFLDQGFLGLRLPHPMEGRRTLSGHHLQEALLFEREGKMHLETDQEGPKRLSFQDHRDHRGRR